MKGNLKVCYLSVPLMSPSILMLVDKKSNTHLDLK